MSGFAYRLKDGQAERVDLAAALADGADMVWAHLNTNEARAQAWLRDRAKLTDYAIDSLTAAETRPRCDAVGNAAFLNLRGRSKDETTSTDPLSSVRIWATKGRVFSVTRQPLFALDAVVSAVEGGQIRDPGDLIAQFAAAITSDLDPQVAALGDELDDCEERLDPNRVFELRHAVTQVRVAAIGYRRFLSPQRQALEKLAALPGDWLQDDDRLHLAAAADRAARMAEELEAIRERSSLMHEALTDLRAEQIDQRSLLISIVAMVFLPLTFLTGLYGMNVEGLPFAKEPWAFAMVAGMCVVITIGIVGYFVKRHWFTR
ncbi:magnesium transporter CorA [Sphingomonas sp. Leaf17]|uniref:zinc transporter ZntB n=1 Tax=Sphingomonas sp. Leaf17 TaxID=1735683 RepID=UPI0006FCE783|nr:zinc transporter ZntB [Sphingomonas sp. Leaf17]KQM64207.1 magnesium transporter CorA [Sphingomonas sp. Leaf17]